MTGYFERKPAAGSQFMFNLKAANHQVILASQRYGSKASAESGIGSVQKRAAADERYQRKVAKPRAVSFAGIAMNLVK